MKNSKLYFLSFSLVFLFCFHPGYTDEWSRVYLATFPRSGNHWVRYLTEEATHIATSSVMCDGTPQHLRKIFPWGGYCCDHGYEGGCRYPTRKDSILIKTHFPSSLSKKTQFDCRPCFKVIRIVRNPVDSFYSLYVKNYNVAHSDQDKFPSDLVIKYTKAWKKFQSYWNKQKNVLTIRYEDMLDNPYEEFKKIVKAAKFKVKKADIERAIAKYPPEGYELKHLNRFSPEDLKYIVTELHELLKMYDYTSL